MNRYTIYCTEEQTKKALELGAPIKAERKFSIDWKEGKRVPYPDVERDKNGEPILIIPTAEQMIGFLRSKRVKFLLSDESDAEGCYWFIGNGEESISCGKEKENKELAAIDAALEYLSNNKK